MGLVDEHVHLTVDGMVAIQHARMAWYRLMEYGINDMVPLHRKPVPHHHDLGEHHQP